MQIEESIKSTTTTTPATSKSELWNLSLRDIFYKYVRFLPLFILSIAFCLFIAYLYLRYAIPVYNVSGSMIIRNQSSSSNSRLEEMMGGGKTESIQNEIEVLRSRGLMERVVDSLNLQWSYYAKGKIKTVNIYNQGPFFIEGLEIADSAKSFTFKIKFINENEFRINEDKVSFKFGQLFKNPNGVFRLIRKPGFSISKEYSVTWMPRYDAANMYANAVSVNLKAPGTGILFIGMRCKNSLLGADIINTLMQEYSHYSVELKSEESVKKLDFIDSRIKILKEQIDSSQNALSEYERQNNLIDSKIQSDDYFNKLSEADKSLNELTIKLETIDIISNSLRDRNRRYETSTSPILDDPAISTMIAEYNKNQIQRKQLLDANVPENNPAVKAAESNIEKYRSSLLENLRNIRGSVAGNISSLRSKSNLSASQLKGMPTKVKEQAKMTRDIEILNTAYKFLLEAQINQSMVKVGNVADSEITNRAFPSSVPVKPNRRAIQMLAIVLGIGLPAVFIFISELMNDKVSTRFDIEKITSAPILGEIGHSYSENVMVVSKTTRSMVAEQFRIIRSNLQYVLNKKDKATILFTSSFSGEGKSYVTTNMGGVLALAGKKTIILEFDIRKPKLLSGLGMPKGQGITNYLIGKGDLKEIIKPVPDMENLYVLGCGPIPPNPSELLLDPRMDDMFAWLKENYDMVLVDTAPVGMVSDAMTLSKYADATLYLVRQGHTFKKQVGLIDEFYQEEKLPKVSIIINDVKIKPGYGYYGYGRYGYGYGYGYGSYYEEEVPPRNFIERVIAALDIRRFFGKPKKRKVKSRS